MVQRQRIVNGDVYQVEENQVECAFHGGEWEPDGQFCLFQDTDDYLGYLNCREIDEPITVNGAEPKVMTKAEAGSDADQFARALGYTGLSPDAPVTENENGGKQSVVEGRFDLLPPVAMFELAKVMEHGAQKYAPKNWMKIPVESHLNHLLMHVFAYLAGDRQEEHLTHALARAAMAVEIEKLGVQDA